MQWIAIDRVGTCLGRPQGRAILRGESLAKVGVSEAHPPHHCPWAGEARLGSGRVFWRGRKAEPYSERSEPNGKWRSHLSARGFSPVDRRGRLFGNRKVVCVAKHKLIATIIGILDNDGFTHLLGKIDGVASTASHVKLWNDESLPHLGDYAVTSHKRATSSASGGGVLGHECTPISDNITSQPKVGPRSDIVEAGRKHSDCRQTVAEGRSVCDGVCTERKPGDHGDGRVELTNQVFKPTA